MPGGGSGEWRCSKGQSQMHHYPTETEPEMLANLF